MTINFEQLLTDSRKPFPERPLAEINKGFTPELYKKMTGHDLPENVFVVGFGQSDGFGLGDNFSLKGGRSFVNYGRHGENIYYCTNAFAKEQGWLKPEIKKVPWTFYALKEAGHVLVGETDGEGVQLFCSYDGDGICGCGGFVSWGDLVAEKDTKLVTLKGELIEPYQEAEV